MNGLNSTLSPQHCHLNPVCLICRVVACIHLSRAGAGSPSRSAGQSQRFPGRQVCMMTQRIVMQSAASGSGVLLRCSGC